MANIITYYSDDAKYDFHWLAYVVLPNGEYWGVRFNGATEEIAKAKAISTWNKEQEKYKRLEPNIEVIINDPWNSMDIRSQQRQGCMEEGPIFKDKPHHNADKVWMRHETEGLKRVPLTEITMYEGKGYYRSGPRSK